MALAALDYEKIKELHGTLTQGLDFGDVEAFQECLSEAGSCCAKGETLRDTAGLGAFASETVATSAGCVRHSVVASPMIDGDSPNARSLSYVSVTSDCAPPVGEGQLTRCRLVRSGLHEDVLVKVANEWKYTSGPRVAHGCQRTGRFVTTAAGKLSSHISGLPCHRPARRATRGKTQHPTPCPRHRAGV